MNSDNVQKFDDYWRTVTRNEEFIRQYGQHKCPNSEDKWHQDLEDAYLQVRPLLASVTERRMFHGLPGGLNPFEAENYHHALVLILNPPELWFGNLRVLCSPEYLALKEAAENEERSVSRTGSSALSMATTQDPLEGVNETGWDILQAMDRVEPRRWKEIGTRAGYSEDKVRQYSTELQEMHLIKKTPRGFVRIITLPGECESR